MILKDIADQINMDVSTVSRVANSKYVSTPYGTKLIKEFFSESMKNNQGEDVSPDFRPEISLLPDPDKADWYRNNLQLIFQANWAGCE